MLNPKFLQIFQNLLKAKNNLITLKTSLREKCPYSDLFWSSFSCIWTEYGEILSISPYSVRMWENVDQNNSDYGHFLRSALMYKTDTLDICSSCHFGYI